MSERDVFLDIPERDVFDRGGRLEASDLRDFLCGAICKRRVVITK